MVTLYQVILSITLQWKPVPIHITEGCKVLRQTILSGNVFGGRGLLSLLGEELLRVLTSNTAEELAGFGPRNAIDKLDAAGEGLVGNLVISDVLSDDILQLDLLF